MCWGGGLEPHFRVLFSAIFHGVSRENFHQGRNLRNWAEAKVWSFVAALHTKFLCVLVVIRFARDVKNPCITRFDVRALLIREFG
jgi:hypothetical protein